MVQLHKQLNGFGHSNICFYIPNTACNMSSVWLKSPKIISRLKTDHMSGATSLVEFNFVFCEGISQLYCWLVRTYPAAVPLAQEDGLVQM